VNVFTFYKIFLNIPQKYLFIYSFVHVLKATDMPFVGNM